MTEEAPRPGTKRALAVAALAVAGAVGIGFLWPRPHIETPAEAPTQALSPAAQTSAKTGAEQQKAIKPSFDVVRVTPEGSTVIAGRSAPNATVIILDNGKELGRVTADKRGEWVFTPETPLAAGTHDLTLKAIDTDGKTVDGDAPVALVVPGGKGGAILAVKTLPDGRSVVLQGPAATSDSGPLGIDLLDFDKQGHIIASGHAEAGKKVAVYLDNALLGDDTAKPSGEWSVEAKNKPLTDGDHLLRADELGPNGGVISRVEVTFHVGGDTVAGTEITIEPGNCLWRIARQHYGQGAAYTVIYQANKGFIRDPNLIYPGQVFKLPAR